MDQVFFRRFDASSLPLSYIVFPFAILFEEEKSYPGVFPETSVWRKVPVFKGGGLDAFEAPVLLLDKNLNLKLRFA